MILEAQQKVKDLLALLEEAMNIKTHGDVVDNGFALIGVPATAATAAATNETKTTLPHLNAPGPKAWISE